MAKCKTPPTTPCEQIAQQILNNYDIKSAEDVQDVLKQIFGPIFAVSYTHLTLPTIA